VPRLLRRRRRRMMCRSCNCEAKCFFSGHLNLVSVGWGVQFPKDGRLVVPVERVTRVLLGEAQPFELAG